MEHQHKILFESQPLKKPRQRKRKQKELDGKEPGKKRKKPGMPGVLPPGGPPSLATPPLPPLPKQEDIDFSAITEQIMQSLRTLPMLSLQEPLVDVFHSVSPLVGMGTHPFNGQHLTCSFLII